MHKVAIIGSRSFPLDAMVGGEIVQLMQGLPPDTLVLTRGSEGFDEFVERVAPMIGLELERRPGHGFDNFDRDVLLAAEADEIWAFLDPNTLHNPNTGTGHMVEKGLHADKSVRAYSVVNSHLIFAGAT